MRVEVVDDFWRSMIVLISLIVGVVDGVVGGVRAALSVGGVVWVCTDVGGVARTGVGVGVGVRARAGCFTFARERFGILRWIAR